MIKKLSILLLVVVGIALISSCSDYLDSDKYFKDRTTLESVFTNKQRVEEWLAYAYTFLRDDNAEVVSKDPGTNPFCFADDIYYGDRDNTYDPTKNELSYNKFKLGEYDENSWNGSWERCYKGINQASIFIHNIDMNKEMTPDEILDYKGQARFVRAYYYWLLLRRYGPVPIIPDEGIDYTESYDKIATPRSSYEEVAEFISSEMIQAAKELQYYRRMDDENVARPTKGSALATRAYALIFAASPLANGNDDEFAQKMVDDKGRRLLSQEYSEEKWAKAAAACRDLIETQQYDLYHVSKSTSNNGPHDRPTLTPPAPIEGPDFSKKNWPEGWANIDPLKSYRNIFDGTASAASNSEILFTRSSRNTSHDDFNISGMVLHQMPKEDGGWNTHGMTQKMVDAYYMADGSNCQGMNDMYANVPGYEGRVDTRKRENDFTTIADLKDNKYPELGGMYEEGKPDDQQKPGVGVSLQYVNREPRFYASVAYNGSMWYYLNDPQESHRNRQVFYYRGTGDGYMNNAYHLRTGIGIKKFVKPTDYPRNYTEKPEPAIRYADILLLYAEALNELTDGASYDIASWDESTTYSISRTKEDMQKGIHPVRIRAGLPDYSSATYADQDLMRTAIKRERMIELMGEGKRYFDLRRWKDTSVEETVLTYGCNVIMDSSNRDKFHTPVATFDLPTAFAPKMYFWPIKHSELKHNVRLTQTPGWTDYD